MDTPTPVAPAEPSNGALGDLQEPQVTVQKSARERSTIGFPYDDLASAIRLARFVQDIYGGTCTSDQLAGAAGASPGSGGFRLKVSAARQFGVFGGAGSNITLTDLGAAVLDPSDVGARVEAFLNVELYRAVYDAYAGKPLPGDQGLEVKMRELGVGSKQVGTARQVFYRSAEQAGFFEHGKARLIEPARTRVAGKQPSGEPPPSPKVKGPSIMEHPLIVGLLSALPDPGEDFPEEDRELFLKTLEMNLAFIYPRRKSGPSPAVQPEASAHVASST